jgi:hypothetical protein
MTYEAIKYLAKYIGYITGLITLGTIMGIVWNAISGMVSQDTGHYAMAKQRIKNLLLAFVISLILTGGLLSWAAGYIDGAAGWMTKIVGWSH